MIFASIDLDGLLQRRRRDSFGAEIDRLATAAGVDPRWVAFWLFIAAPSIAPLPLTLEQLARLEAHAPSAAPTLLAGRASRLGCSST